MRCVQVHRLLAISFAVWTLTDGSNRKVSTRSECTSEKFSLIDSRMTESRVQA